LKYNSINLVTSKPLNPLYLICQNAVDLAAIYQQKVHALCVEESSIVVAVVKNWIGRFINYCVQKKLPKKLQPSLEVTQIIVETLDSKKGKDIRMLQHLLLFAEYQFGKGVAGNHYREMENGDRISNWIVEIDFLNEIITDLADLYGWNVSLSIMSRDYMASPYLERSLSILNPWLINLDSDSSNRMNSLSKDQIDRLLDELIYTEQNVATLTGNRRQFDVMEGHCQRCLVYSRKYALEGEKKTTSIFTALRTYCNLRMRQGNLSDALSFAEESYNLVVKAYDPVHPQVQEAAGELIHILIEKSDLFDAERYAQVTYGNLRDKKNRIDQESEAVAYGAYNLADMISQQDGDLVKAEEIARESLRITSVINGSNDQIVGSRCNLLANILRTQGKLGDETRRMYERFLAISIRNSGPNGSNTAIGNYYLGLFHYHLSRKQATVGFKTDSATTGEIALRRSSSNSLKNVWSYSSNNRCYCI
jgi:hypothetical protein